MTVMLSENASAAWYQVRIMDIFRILVERLGGVMKSLVEGDEITASIPSDAGTARESPSAAA